MKLCLCVVNPPVRRIVIGTASPVWRVAAPGGRPVATTSSSVVAAPLATGERRNAKSVLLVLLNNLGRRRAVDFREDDIVK